MTKEEYKYGRRVHSNIVRSSHQVYNSRNCHEYDRFTSEVALVLALTEFVEQHISMARAAKARYVSIGTMARKDADFRSNTRLRYSILNRAAVRTTMEKLCGSIGYILVSRYSRRRC